MSATDPIQACVDDGGGSIPPPPGDCTAAAHRIMQDDVKAKCDQGRRTCQLVQTCAVLLENLRKNTDCAAARKTINDTCFRGGDPGHIQAMANALNAAAICQRYIARNCRPPNPVQLPQPAPIPVPDDGFMRRMQEITGLTGAALIAYIIISEGSRLFPPRNLIPIP